MDLKKNIILASASPRRKELLELTGIPFSVRVSHVEEYLSEGITPEMAVQELARQKGGVIAKENPEDIVIGADTVVVNEGKILGKPKDRPDAEEMLRSLSGKKHSVYTGVAVFQGDSCITFAERTEVELYTLEEWEIQSYLDTAEPYDKAGAYAIQGNFARFVKGISGDYYNVVGLPISHLYQVIKKYAD